MLLKYLCQWTIVVKISFWINHDFACFLICHFTFHLILLFRRVLFLWYSRIYLWYIHSIWRLVYCMHTVSDGFIVLCSKVHNSMLLIAHIVACNIFWRDSYVYTLFYVTIFLFSLSFMQSVIVKLRPLVNFLADMHPFIFSTVKNVCSMSFISFHRVSVFFYWLKRS